MSHQYTTHLYIIAQAYRRNTDTMLNQIIIMQVVPSTTTTSKIWYFTLRNTT